MSASLRKRPNHPVASKCRERPNAPVSRRWRKCKSPRSVCLKTHNCHIGSSELGRACLRFVAGPQVWERSLPAIPGREGRAYHGEKDKMGKAFHDEILKTAQTSGSGWVDYWLPKPGQTEPSHKWSYVKAVKADGVAVVGAGFFPN